MLGDRSLAAKQREVAQAAVEVGRRAALPRPAVEQERVAAVEVGPEQRQVSVERQALVAPREATAETEAMQPAQPAQPPVKRLGSAVR